MGLLKKMLVVYLCLACLPACLQSKAKTDTGNTVPTSMQNSALNLQCTQEGNIWDAADTRCLQPKAYCLIKNDGSIWDDATSRCLSLSDQCLAQNNGSQWRNGTCVTGQTACAQDKGVWQNNKCYIGQDICTLKGDEFLWTDDGQCRHKTFLELCQSPDNANDTALQYTFTVLRNQSNTQSCEALFQWMSQQTSLTLYFPDSTTQKITDVSAIRDFSNLTTLYLPGQNINDLEAIGTLTNLQNLSVEMNPNLADITPLSNLTQLIQLYLGQDQIVDITALTGLKNLTLLSIYNNLVSDLTPLKNSNKMVTLHINNNPIRDINALIQMTALQELRLEYTPIFTDRTPADCPLTGPTSLVLSFCQNKYP
jgi:Leucine-rich repeat (LRR) protein